MIHGKIKDTMWYVGDRKDFAYISEDFDPTFRPLFLKSLFVLTKFQLWRQRVRIPPEQIVLLCKWLIY